VKKQGEDMGVLTAPESIALVVLLNVRGGWANRPRNGVRPWACPCCPPNDRRPLSDILQWDRANAKDPGPAPVGVAGQNAVNPARRRARPALDQTMGPQMNKARAGRKPRTGDILGATAAGRAAGGHWSENADTVGVPKRRGKETPVRAGKKASRLACRARRDWCQPSGKSWGGGPGNPKTGTKWARDKVIDRLTKKAARSGRQAGATCLVSTPFPAAGPKRPAIRAFTAAAGTDRGAIWEPGSLYLGDFQVARLSRNGTQDINTQPSHRAHRQPEMRTVFTRVG